MAGIVKFAKYQGLGNDFILIDDRANRLKLKEKEIRKLCDRHYGVGCDQLMIVRKSDKADFRMLLYNQDGSRVEMCGNGIRCFHNFLLRNRISRRKKMRIETDAGIISTATAGNMVEVDMGEPILDGPMVPINRQGQVVNSPLSTDAGKFNITAVSMGNPHAVIFVKAASSVPIEKFGPAIEKHPVFPKKTNVMFAQVVTRKKISLNHWERGAGVTQACGTGACATAVAGVLNSFTERSVTVAMRGGSLKIRWDEKTNHVFMTGPAEEVFTGSMAL